VSQNAEGPPPARPRRGVELGIFFVGLVCLMVQLLHTRMLAFFLGSISNFLAIPVSLLGLALGSLLVQRARNEEKPDARRLIAILQALVLPVLAAAFVGFFAVANACFPVIHVSLENPYGDAARLLAYSGIFLPSYALFGALLALIVGAALVFYIVIIPMERLLLRVIEWIAPRVAPAAAPAAAPTPAPRPTSPRTAPAAAPAAPPTAAPSAPRLATFSPPLGETPCCSARRMQSSTSRCAISGPTWSYFALG